MSRPVLGLLAGLAVVSAASLLPRTSGSRALDSVTRLRRALSSTAGSANRGSFASRKKVDLYAPVVDEMLRIDPKDVPDELLLAVLLMGSVDGDPVVVARQTLSDVSGNLHRVLRSQGFDARGLKPLSRARMTATRELVRRANLRGVLQGDGPVIDAPDKVVDLARVLSTGRRERLTAAYLDNGNRVLSTRELSVGSSRWTMADPIEVFRPAVEMSATGIVLIHNHPSGQAQPSTQDDDLTQNIAKGAKLLRIKLIDHVIVTPTSYFSFAAMKPGLLY